MGKMLEFGGMRMTPGVSALLWFGFLTTCCMAWPVTNYRRSYNYYPAEDVDIPAEVPWYVAQEPAQVSYDLPENYYLEAGDEFGVPVAESEPESDTQWTDIQALTNLMELYDNAADPAASTWGQIVNERPESELEELKNLQKHHEPEKVVKGKVAFSPISATTSPVVTPSNIPVVATALKSQPVNPKVNQHHQGQKEIPLLRPPNKPKVVEPEPVIAQRSLDVEQKPSPYDTLRKYLSIEDALKKEAEKRRASSAGNSSRQKKRSYVTDEDTLTGQLTNLKKSAV